MGYTVVLNVGRGLAPAVLQGKVTLPMESHKDSFVDPGTLCGFCIGLLALPQQNFATLRMTYRRGIRGGRMFARTRTARPYERAVFILLKCSRDVYNMAIILRLNYRLLS